jgi:transcriptional regulator with PAS, ATPase and Fis domain
MKDRVETKIARPEIATTDDARESSERVWLAPALPRSIEPLLSGLRIELLAPGDRERATIRVEALAADGRAGLSTRALRGDIREGLRIDRARGRAQHAQDTHGPQDRQKTHETWETRETRETNDAIEFEGPGVWAAASYIVSQAFGLSPPLMTTDAAMFAVIRAATRAGQAGSPILVTGETGTGKELLVRLIHAASGRAGGMSSVNCAALNDAALFSLSTLKDAPDAAARGAAGAENRLDELCAAPGTTLFLDQVSELSPASQTRVLRAILRAGDCVAGESVDGEPRRGARLVSATNRPLGPMVSSGRFKRELYDRLAVLTLRVPPLRERGADIELLAAAFLRAATPRLSFTAGALKALGGFPFPGNVRELHNLVTRLAIMPRDGGSQLIDTADVRPELLGHAVSASIWRSSPLRMRREMAMQALTVCDGDRTAAARKLGISLRALQRHVPRLR